MSKIWKDIHGYNGYYQVSNYGDVVSKRGTRKLQCNSCGYLKLELFKNNIAKTHLVHRLVAEAFIPNPLNCETVNHKNGNTKDNSLSNLEWMTLKQNARHSYDVLGRKKNIFTEKAREKTRQKIKMYNLKKEYIKTFPSITDVIEWLKSKGHTKADRCGITRVCTGKQNKAYEHTYEYTK